MNEIEYDQSANSMPEPILEESGGAELTATQPFPVLEQLVKKVELPTEQRARDFEAVISKVIELGETSRTLERILERKHEVKDLAAAESKSIQQASKLAELIETRKDTLMQAVSSHASQGQVSRFRQVITGRTIYGYAIRYGFLSGILALTIAIFAVAMFT